MIERIPYLWPEIALFAATCVVMVVGLSPSLAMRRLCMPIAALGLVLAGILAITTAKPSPCVLPNLQPFIKAVAAAVGLIILLMQAGAVDRDEEEDLAAGRPFEALRTNRAEYFSFYLFSITGLMLVASARDLVWLFLALELTSLPTYIMVTISGWGRRTNWRSPEAGVKYFFLGALGAAVFLYGFVLLYGGTGSTSLDGIAAVFARGDANPIALTGLLIAVIGVSFKIAAVPMHFYTPDVYQGAAAPVGAFLAFVPKTAGFVAILLLCAAAGWTWGPGGAGTGESLPEPLRVTLWTMAALTMTVGNVLAILQSSVKRMLAYSSIAHSGYMLVGVIAGPGEGTFSTSGIAAVLFYLLTYGVMNVGAFAVVACLERRGSDGAFREAESVDDLRGLCATRPMLGWTMVVCALSLLGMPPLLGFFGKFGLFASAISAGEIPLVVVLGVNSAIAAFYYLRLVFAPLIQEPLPADARPQEAPFPTRRLAGLISAVGVVALVVVADRLMAASRAAAGEAAMVAGVGTDGESGVRHAGKR